jgi:hypothetical protein
MDCIATREKTFRKQVSKPKVRTPLRRVRLWTRLSPAHLLRAFVDNYVKGCVTFANDSEVDARASALHVVCDDNGAGFSSASRSRYAQGAPAPEQGSVHLTHKHHDIVTGCHGKPSISLSLLGQIQYLLVDELERIHFSRSFMLRTFK